MTKKKKDKKGKKSLQNKIIFDYRSFKETESPNLEVIFKNLARSRPPPSSQLGKSMRTLFTLWIP